LHHHYWKREKEKCTMKTESSKIELLPVNTYIHNSSPLRYGPNNWLERVSVLSTQTEERVRLRKRAHIVSVQAITERVTAAKLGD
jgi:hypothetical protein